MKATATFTVADFKPAELNIDSPVTTALPVSVSTMQKLYSGDIAGRSTTIFSAAFDPAVGGSYVALESFEGSIGERSGTFNFLHSAATKGSDRRDEFFAIVEGSGTGDLKGITGTGGITADATGHRIWFDYAIT